MHLIVETKYIFSRRGDIRVIDKETGKMIPAKNLTIIFDADDWFSFSLDGTKYILDGINNTIEFVHEIQNENN